MLELLLALGIFALYLALPMILVKERDSRALVTAVATGVVVGLLGAIIGTLLAVLIPSFFSSPTEIILFAPLREECLKFLGCLIYLKKRASITTTPKTIVFGYNLGLGFGLQETLSFTVGAPLSAILPRVFLTTPMHMLASSTSAHGIGYALKTGKKLYYSLFWLAVAFAIHALFNVFALNVRL